MQNSTGNIFHPNFNKDRGVHSRERQGRTQQRDRGVHSRKTKTGTYTAGKQRQGRTQQGNKDRGVYRGVKTGAYTAGKQRQRRAKHLSKKGKKI